ncbi:Hypothetical protein Minf_0297 [Methylacidiphilum infernorum V4]|uniref:Uncharacterized protein n=1 Tax=Methylacidiphilum infernorum (isolate V4) TaxID=481448 RepID=B3DY80_METI4|nr:Hypothetical protein Minf_0297 [Methylacidiphilum infernorum V4]
MLELCSGKHSPLSLFLYRDKESLLDYLSQCKADAGQVMVSRSFPVPSKSLDHEKTLYRQRGDFELAFILARR